MTDVGKWLDG